MLLHVDMSVHKYAVVLLIPETAHHFEEQMFDTES